MNCSLPGSSVQGIFQARGLEWVAIAFSEAGGLGIVKFSKIRGQHSGDGVIWEAFFFWMELHSFFSLTPYFLFISIYSLTYQVYVFLHPFNSISWEIGVEQRKYKGPTCFEKSDHIRLFLPNFIWKSDGWIQWFGAWSGTTEIVGNHFYKEMWETAPSSE